MQLAMNMNTIGNVKFALHGPNSSAMVTFTIFLLGNDFIGKWYFMSAFILVDKSYLLKQYWPSVNSRDIMFPKNHCQFFQDFLMEVSQKGSEK